MARIETILIIQKGNKIILGLKNPEKKFGNKWNGFGGGLESGETLEEAAIRETLEETGAAPKDLTKRGIILFEFESDEQDHEVHIFRAGDYEGKLTPSEDFSEYREFSETDLVGVYPQMMPADRHWLPLFIQRKLFRGEVKFDKKFKNPEVNIYQVESLN